PCTRGSETRPTSARTASPRPWGAPRRWSPPWAAYRAEDRIGPRRIPPAARPALAHESAEGAPVRASGRRPHRLEARDRLLQRALGVAVVGPGLAAAKQSRHAAQRVATWLEPGLDLPPGERHRHGRM